MSDRDYVAVPVPRHLVMDVLRLITADDARTEAPRTSNAQLPLVEVEESRQWSRAELQVIWDNRDKSSVEKFGRLLTVLADAFPDRMTKAEIGDALGLEFLRLQNALGRFSKFIENQLGDNRWPLLMDADRWGVDEQTADHWRSITSGESND